jgi:hypothetical protein
MNWGSAGDAIAGIIMSGIIGIGMISTIMFFVGAAKGDYRKKRRRRSPYRATPRTSYETPEFRYVENTHAGHYYVYFVENKSLNAVKLGVGTSGRVLQILRSKTTASHESPLIGWNVIRLAKFSDLAEDFEIGKGNACEAEKRVHFYWRKVLGHPRFLQQHEMGYSQVEMYGRIQWQPTKGYTETAKLNEICEATTWKYVCSSPGFISEEEWLEFPSRDLKLIDTDGIQIDIPLGYEDYKSQRVNHEGATPREVIEESVRFWNKVEKTETCWLWIGAKSETGYGLFNFEGRVQLAHRIAWTIKLGKGAAESYLDNSCGIRNCVNPEHWRVGFRKKLRVDEVRISKFTCVTEDCGKPSVTISKPGLCDSCKQKAKRERRRLRENELRNSSNT